MIGGGASTVAGDFVILAQDGLLEVMTEQHLLRATGRSRRHRRGSACRSCRPAGHEHGITGRRCRLHAGFGRCG